MPKGMGYGTGQSGGISAGKKPKTAMNGPTVDPKFGKFAKSPKSREAYVAMKRRGPNSVGKNFTT